MAQIKKNCLSNLSRAAASDVTVDHLTDTFSLMMYTRELENVAKNGTPAAREMLYQMSPEKLMGIYQNVYLKSPDVQESINRFQLLGAEGGHTITDHLGLGMCDAIEELGPDLKKYEPEDLALANATADYLVQQKKNLAKEHKLAPIDLGKAFDQLAESAKAEQGMVKENGKQKVNGNTKKESQKVLGGS